MLPLTRHALHRLALAAGLGLSVPAWALEEGGASCPQLDFGVPAPELALDPEQVILNADNAALEEGGLSKLTGSVRLRQGDKLFSAEQMDFDDRENSVRVNAESVFRNREMSVRSQQSEFDLDSQTGVFHRSEFTMPASSAHGTAERLSLNREGEADMEKVSFTTCAPKSRGWELKAGDIHMDREEGFGTARNARLDFLGVPILYAPWFRFPIDDRRHTGLLYPTIGDSDRTGFDMQVPLYINLAPNYDATLTPRLMTERGTQVATDFRYLLGSGEGKARYEYLSEDRQTGEMRDYLHFEHQSLINRRTALSMQYDGTSDQSYFEDFGGRLDLTAITHLERSARLTYQAPAAYRVQALVQDFQPLSSALVAVDDPYRRLPQVLVDAETRKSLFDTRAGFNGEYVNFAREDSVQGQRIDLRPYLRTEREGAAWFARGQLEYDYTTYRLTDLGFAPGQSQDPSRSLPSLSAEYGLRFERVTDSGQLQLLEPRAFYLYTPYENQDDLPVFDGGEPDFEFTQLFAHNRFLGRDRVSDANQVAIAASLRQLDPDSGVTRFNASLGQLFRLEAPRVTLPGGTAPDSGATDFIASLDYRISEKLRTVLAAQWSPNDNKFNRSSLGLSYRSERRRLDVGYRYRENQLEQTDLILSTPLWQRWSAAGRWRYSVDDNQTLDSQAGLQYETCCWTMRTSYRRYIATTAGEYSSGVYVQLVLKGLGQIGSGGSSLLQSDSDFYQ
ncbi:LPS-assembly protein LptD [Solimonas sp. K1W22B-7]|uniref:LPS-assembly protein LptD n=1 Tax=Solimonas sp. K1W22B-7 TaxID=2303331 RepID=UPI0013C4B682|nr:LPS assembly protein LptD [Solimonas sp. K1W22B-7]